MELTSCQQVAYNKALKGGNIFVTGAGGVGKTFLVHKLLCPKSVIGCPTGAAAQVVGGVTNHRLFGAPIGVIKPDAYKRVKNNVLDILSKVEKLFLDEISMVRLDMFEHIDNTMRRAKGVDKPFGGVQVIATGDFYQLSSFIGWKEKRAYQNLYGNKISAFQSKSWCFDTVELATPVRNNNKDQYEALNCVRKGLDTGKAVNTIKKLSKSFDVDLDWTHLCAYNKDADKRNKNMYSKLKTPEKIYNGVIKGSKKAVLKEVKVPELLPLKAGTRVITIINSPENGYVNGSIGEVVDLLPNSVIVRLDDGKLVEVEKFKFDITAYKTTKDGFKKVTVGSIEQLPLISGWAISIHKSQGATLDNAVINLGEYTFASALVYVAISRVKDLRNIAFTRELRVSDIKVDLNAKKFMDNIKTG